jgi:hypothetical protein
MWASSGVGLHISFQSLQDLDALSAGKIASVEDATAYVRKAAAICGTTDPSLVPTDIESRLATAEWEASKEPAKLVSDDQVAEAFNFISEEFQVPHPAHLTAQDILQYRSVMASMFPHLFNGKGENGSRPVGAVVIIRMLLYSGGLAEGARKAAQLDRPPGGLKMSPSSGWSGPDRNPNIAAAEYRVAGQNYFGTQPPKRIGSFIERLAQIIGLPGGR